MNRRRQQFTEIRKDKWIDPFRSNDATKEARAHMLSGHHVYRVLYRRQTVQDKTEQGRWILVDPDGHVLGRVRYAGHANREFPEEAVLELLDRKMRRPPRG